MACTDDCKEQRVASLVTECCGLVTLTFMVYSIESGKNIEHVGIRMY